MLDRRFKNNNIKSPVFLSFFLVSILGLFCLPVVFASQVVASDKTTIHVKKGRTKDYYHMEYVLTAKNLIMPDSKSELTLINEGGHFVVYIKKEAFPVLAPHCSENIELDMPWTKSTRISALKKISKKTALYQSLLEVLNGTKKEQKVIIELNPNITVKNKKPLDLELTKCNIYFRTARDEYVDYIGRLR